MRYWVCWISPPSGRQMSPLIQYLYDFRDRCGQRRRLLTTVARRLDMFVAMVMTGVDITLQYPTLVAGFPRSQEALAYYR